MIFMPIPPSPLTHILSWAPLIVMAFLTFAYSALNMSHTDDISHIAVEATELEFHLPIS